jgi:hypothetical protein
MNRTSLDAFRARAAASQMESFGGTIRVSGAEVTAIFTAPRLDPSLAESTVRVDKYTSTVRILKSAVSSITTPAAWVGVLIELPEASSYRSYHAIPEFIEDLQLSSEWGLQIKSV